MSSSFALLSCSSVHCSPFSLVLSDISNVLLPKIELISLETLFVKLLKNAGGQAGMNRVAVKAWPSITAITVEGLGLNVNCKYRFRLYVSVMTMIVSSMYKRSHTMNHFLLVFGFFELFGPSVPAAFQTWQCVYMLHRQTNQTAYLNSDCTPTQTHSWVVCWIFNSKLEANLNMNKTTSDQLSGGSFGWVKPLEASESYRSVNVSVITDQLVD